MKKNIFPALITALICLSAFAIFTGNWKIKDNESQVKFTSGRINGTFSGLKADIQFDKKHPEQAKIAASIDAGTVATGFFLKNDHAKDALGADKYATIRFVATSVTKNADAFDAVGKLTMKGVTKPATIHFTFEDKETQGIFKGTFKVIPKDFGIDRNGTPDHVDIELTVPVTKS
ncbi:YceI family protein [Pedobacter sp. L105]|uniref:YceI family protein n=1 Tax=Pedobacter sp. L105 TaxID=1641871 RepID=UPI00131C1915|nr:YceI family protein [Pedobacter sp. L105]